MSDTPKDTFARFVMMGLRRMFLISLIALMLFIVTIILTGGRSAYAVEIPFHLVCGWALHGWKALPPFFEKWQAAVLPLGCLLMAAVLAHRFIRRWVVEKRPALDWRVRHTVAVVSLILLGSAAAIASSGIVHQFFWLAGGKVTQSNRRGDLTMAVNNGRQLMMALFEYETEKGRYPHSFGELESAFEMEFEDKYYAGMIRRLWWLGTINGKVPEPWVLLHPGSAATALGDEPVIVSPVVAGEGMVVVGYGDSTVRTIRVEKLGELLDQARMKVSEGGR